MLMWCWHVKWRRLLSFLFTWSLFVCHLAVSQKYENRFVLILATSFVMLDLFCPYPIRGEVQKLTTGRFNLYRSSFQSCANWSLLCQWYSISHASRNSLKVVAWYQPGQKRPVSCSLHVKDTGLEKTKSGNIYTKLPHAHYYQHWKHSWPSKSQRNHLV